MQITHSEAAKREGVAVARPRDKACTGFGVLPTVPYCCYFNENFKRLRYDLRKWYTSLSKMKLLIQACNSMILAFDNLEDQRALSRPEFNFRKIVKLHLEGLLHLQFIYWKQRCTIRWIKVGEENSKFFQAMANERLRRNIIASLTNDDGAVINEHQQMASLLWGSFKNRMGVANGIEM